MTSNAAGVDGEQTDRPEPIDPHEPTPGEAYTAGYALGRSEGYDHGYGDGYDACLRDNGLAEDPDDLPPRRDVENVVEGL